MPRVMTENQYLLTGYLIAVGCSMAEAFKITMNTWDEMATIEMLEFCRDNRAASSDELLNKSLELSLKYPTEEYDWEVEEDDH